MKLNTEILDQPEKVKALDKSGMLEACEKTPHFCKEALVQARKVKIPNRIKISDKIVIDYKIPKNILIVGMGGSAIGGEILRDRLIDKVQTLLIIKAKTKTVKGKEHFWYYEGSILTGCNNRRFFELIKEGKVILDIRMHLKATGKARNHGTGFRMYERYLEELYLNKDRVL